MHERQAAAVAWLRRKCIAGSYRGAAHRAPAIGCTGCQWAAPAARTRTEGLHRPTGHGHWQPASRTRRLERSLRSVWASGATGYRKRPTGPSGCAPAASIEPAAPAIEGLRTGHGCQHRSAPTNRGAAHRTGCQHRRRLHGHGWRPIEREPRGCTAPATAASGCTGHAHSATASIEVAQAIRRRLHRANRPSAALARQHRRRLHGHGWRPIERERPTEGLRTATGHGCTGHRSAPANRPRPLVASIEGCCTATVGVQSNATGQPRGCAPQPATAASGCTGHATLGTASIEAHRPSEGLHRAPAIGCQHRSAPANRGAAPAQPATATGCQHRAQGV